MRCWVLVLMLLGGPALGQEWSASVGIAGSCSVFLKDKTVLPQHTRITFAPGGGISAGLKYTAVNGFDAYLDAGVSAAGIQYPVPDVRSYNSYFVVSSLQLLAGTGPRLPVGTNGTSITPFLKLGAAYLHIWDDTYSDQSNNVLVVRKDGPYKRNSWGILCAIGVDWRFEAAVPSAIGLQLSYTPQNVFRDPVAYTATTSSDRYELWLQGKILQLQLMYRVHWRFKKAATY